MLFRAVERENLLDYSVIMAVHAAASVLQWFNSYILPYICIQYTFQDYIIVQFF